MSEKYLITKNIIYNFIGQIVLLLIGFFTAPFIIHTLGNTYYGILAVVTAVVGYFSLLDFGLGVSIIKYISEYKAKEDKKVLEKIIGTALTIYIVIGFLGYSLIMIFAKVLVSKFLQIPTEIIPVAISVFYISAFSFFVNMVLTVFNSIPNAYQRMDITNSRNIFVGLLNSLGAVIILALGYRIIEVSIWSVFVSLFASLIFYREIRKILGSISLKPTFDKEIFYKLLKFGGFKFVANVGGQIVFQLDKILIGFFHPIALVTFYTAPTTLVQKGLSFIVNISSAIFPALSESHGLNDQERTKSLYLRMTKIITFLVFPMMLGLYLFADKILLVWLGQEFAEKSTLTLKILAPAYFIAAMSAPGVLMTDAAGKPGIAAFFALISGVINLTAALILIPKYGIEGAATALLINFVAQVPIFLGIVHKKIVKISNFEVLKNSILKPVVSGIVAGVLVFSLNFFPNNQILNLLINLAIFGGLYLSLNLAIGTLDQHDRMTIQYLLNKLNFKKGN